MSVNTSPLDADWLTTVPAVGLPSGRLGQPAGLFFVGMAVTGDLSGGGVTLTGGLSFTKKQEFIYEWVAIGSFTDSILQVGDSVELTLNSGPILPAGLFGNAFTNVTFKDQAVATINAFSDFSAARFTLGQGGQVPMIGYGDTRLSGNFSMIIVRWEVNDLADEYFAFGWGFYYLYQTFFRGFRPG